MTVLVSFGYSWYLPACTQYSDTYEASPDRMRLPNLHYILQENCCRWRPGKSSFTGLEKAAIGHSAPLGRLL